MVQGIDANARAREKAKAKRVIAVESVRDEARVALDAFLEGRGRLADRIPALLKLAMTDYRLRFPPDDPAARTGLSGWQGFKRRGGKTDCYCLYCGDLVRTVAKHHGPWKPGDRVKIYRWVTDHVARCALLCLAGMIDPVPPGTRKYPT